MFVMFAIVALVAVFYAAWEVGRAWSWWAAAGMVVVGLGLMLVPYGFIPVLIGSVAAARMAWTRKYEEIAMEQEVDDEELDDILTDLE